MIRTVFRVPTPKHTWNSSDRQTDSRTILNHSTRTILTLYKRCSRIAKLLFYVSSWQGEERQIIYILRLTPISRSDFIEKLLYELTCKQKFVIKNQLKC